ncbi:MAG: DegT/DnrJ/EryC1/StrS family aminotransferase, partial [Phycisphaeraceae bacterium]|nr:DegT/DnrJ/EryC1/StrS family aminotransferase [Phycisphaeraceae bacterium]
PRPTATMGEAFDQRACEVMDVKYARGTSSGTGALHAAMVAVGVQAGTEVILPALGFVATAMAVRVAGGKPVFCDINASLQIDPAKIEACITPQTVAIAPTHYMGRVCDMDPILAVAKKHNLKVVEDCAQSPGAQYKGKYVGTMGDIGCFSISCYKIIGGGEGGMFITHNERLFERSCQLAEAGGLWRGAKRFHQPDYEGQIFWGTNYRMSELEAAIDLVQIGKLNDVVARSRKVSQRILGQLKTYKEIQPQVSNDPQGDIGYLLRYLPATPELAAQLTQALSAEGIGGYVRPENATPDWHLYNEMLPITLTDNHDSYQAGACPVTDHWFGRMVNMGLKPWLSEEDCDAIAAGMNKVFDAYCTEDSNASAWI